MPLHKGSSSKVVGQNIRELMSTGKYGKKQAIAISLHTAGKDKKRKKK